MRQLLVINPNTSASVSALLQMHAQAAAGPEVRVRTVTSRFGAPYIACEASFTVAGHATLDAWAYAMAEDEPAPDAVLIGCFGDPGLLALQQTSLAPVTGLAQAAFTEAARFGRFAIVTGGARWQPILQRLAHALGHADALAGIHTVAPTGVELAQQPQAALALLSTACQEAARMFRADSIVLGGAGLAGMAALVQHAVAVPVIDSVLAGTRQALLPLPTSATGRFDVEWDRLSTELMARGR